MEVSQVPRAPSKSRKGRLHGRGGQPPRTSLQSCQTLSSPRAWRSAGASKRSASDDPVVSTGVEVSRSRRRFGLYDESRLHGRGGLPICYSMNDLMSTSSPPGWRSSSAGDVAYRLEPVLSTGVEVFLPLRWWRSGPVLSTGVEVYRLPSPALFVEYSLHAGGGYPWSMAWLN